MKVIKIAFFVSLIVVYFSCATSSGDQFLVENLSDIDKSNAVTDKGIMLYNVKIKETTNFTSILEVKDYFEVALEYNPDNKTAQSYLVKIDNYLEAKLKDNIALANKYNDKTKKTEQDNFNVVYFLERAYEIDPDNKNVVKLRKETEKLRKTLVSKYVELGINERQVAVDESDSVKKENGLIAAYKSFDRALLLEKDNKSAISEQEKVKKLLAGLMDDQIAKSDQEIKKGSFKDAENTLKKIRYLNGILDNQYSSDVNNNVYTLYYYWAADFLRKKQYDNAETRIRWAISTKNTTQAQALRNKIITQRKQNVLASSFGDVLKDIDSLIKNNKLVSANNKIVSIYAKYSDAKSRKLLDARKKQITSQLSGVYKQGVALYNKENYSEAIKSLEIVVEIKVDYEQAANYLEKAKAKKKLLDSF